jgi:isopropylmalate/homocitrate/citramalate synthase
VPDIVLCECFARDGLQHEPQTIPAADKAAMIGRIADAGFRRIEITSFSHPKHVPQFADADAVLAALDRNKRFLRGEIARRINLKFAPEVRFRIDERFDEAERIEKLLRTPAVQRDLHDKDDNT